MSVLYPAVSSQARLQPDLYAAAFTRELLTHDYRTSRDQLLAWVQSESAQSTEPLVVGLTPVIESSLTSASVVTVEHIGALHLYELASQTWGEPATLVFRELEFLHSAIRDYLLARYLAASSFANKTNPVPSTNVVL